MAGFLVKSFGVLREYGVDGCFLLAVEYLYSCSEDCVRVDGAKSQPFSVGVGLQQWCVLSLFLFTVYIRVLLNYGLRAKSDLRSHFTRPQNTFCQ